MQYHELRNYEEPIVCYEAGVDRQSMHQHWYTAHVPSPGLDSQPLECDVYMSEPLLALYQALTSPGCWVGCFNSPKCGGICEPGTKSRLTPFLLMLTVRIQPPDEPSLAMAWPTAFCTNALHSSSDMPAFHCLSHNP